MKPPSTDTSEDAHKVQIALLRAMTPAKRVALIGRIRAGVHAMANARLKATYPNDDARTQQLRLAALRLDDETMIRVIGWDPAHEGR